MRRRHSKGNNRINLPPEVQRVLNALREVKDPETDLNIVDEGLIYGLTIEDRTARIRGSAYIGIGKPM
ncbi:MAG: hypothetical protein DRN26_02280 [Thermoplasmata archaeon]|nr:MAG: hypothetical protein DRN26_02280 [Thermoplasmata archaeon]